MADEKSPGEDSKKDRADKEKSPDGLMEPPGPAEEDGLDYSGPDDGKKTAGTSGTSGTALTPTGTSQSEDAPGKPVEDARKKEAARDRVYLKMMSRLMQARCRRAAAAIKQEVEMHYFGQMSIAPAILDTLQLCQFLFEANPKIRPRIYDDVSDKEKVAEFGVLFFPTIVIRAKNRGNLRFLGTPAGHCVPVLIDAITRASDGVSGLRPRTMENLIRLKYSLNLKVFITPEDPFCQRVAKTAFRMAIDSPKIRTEVINAHDFTALARRYRFDGVCKTVINDNMEIAGTPSEAELVERVLEFVTVQNPMYY